VLILLDENCPLALHHRLREAGLTVEHIILLGQRGLPDRDIRVRLAREEIIFLTQDTEFEEAVTAMRGKIIISRVRQSRPIAERVSIWFTALVGFVANMPRGHLFELLESAEVVPLRSPRRA